MTRSPDAPIADRNARLPDLMTAIEIERPGGPEVLHPVPRPVPRPDPGEVLVRVAAAGVNRPDRMQRLGKYPPPPGTPDIPGLEIAGTIVAQGPSVGGSSLEIGRQICALVAGGGYAEYCVAPAPQCLPLPDGLTLVEAAGLPETFFTVWTNVFERGALKPGEWLLVHGGTSGIGTTAIQLGRAFGAHVIATAGTEPKCDACLVLGARACVNYRVYDFVEAVMLTTNGRGVDVILDIIGGEYVDRNLSALASDGRLVQIGLMGGARAQVNLTTILQRRLTITGSTLRPRTVEEKGAIARALEANVWPLLSQGTVKPIIHATFPLARAADAHRALERGDHIGKIVLTIGES
jgi:putative PIG3 family NAD(P)H quinone oxidoreductase